MKNGKFNSINDFLNRVNPKDINKLQLEGLVKAGAFDNLNKNRQSLYNSIPNIILKSKNIFENNSANQIDLFNLRILKNLNEVSKLTSIEANEEFAQIAREHIEISGLSKNHLLKVGKSSEIIPTLREQYDFVFIDHWKDIYLKDLKLLEEFGLLKKGAWVFADNVVLFNLEDYLDYVRTSPNFESKFIPTLREYSKSHPDGVEISRYKS